TFRGLARARRQLVGARGELGGAVGGLPRPCGQLLDARGRLVRPRGPLVRTGGPLARSPGEPRHAVAQAGDAVGRLAGAVRELLRAVARLVGAVGELTRTVRGLAELLRERGEADQHVVHVGLGQGAAEHARRGLGDHLGERVVEHTAVGRRRDVDGRLAGLRRVVATERGRRGGEVLRDGHDRGVRAVSQAVGSALLVGDLPVVAGVGGRDGCRLAGLGVGSLAAAHETGGELSSERDGLAVDLDRLVEVHDRGLDGVEALLRVPQGRDEQPQDHQREQRHRHGTPRVAERLGPQPSRRGAHARTSCSVTVVCWSRSVVSGPGLTSRSGVPAGARSVAATPVEPSSTATPSLCAAARAWASSARAARSPTVSVPSTTSTAGCSRSAWRTAPAGCPSSAAESTTATRRRTEDARSGSTRPAVLATPPVRASRPETASRNALTGAVASPRTSRAPPSGTRTLTGPTTVPDRPATSRSCTATASVAPGSGQSASDSSRVRPSPSTSNDGRTRSSQRGMYQAFSPSRASTAGTKTMRTTKASTATPTARPSAMGFRFMSPCGTNATKTAIMMTAAAVTTFAEPWKPVVIA